LFFRQAEASEAAKQAADVLNRERADAAAALIAEKASAAEAAAKARAEATALKRTLLLSQVYDVYLGFFYYIESILMCVYI